MVGNRCVRTFAVALTFVAMGCASGSAPATRQVATFATPVSTTAAFSPTEVTPAGGDTTATAGTPSADPTQSDGTVTTATDHVVTTTAAITADAPASLPVWTPPADALALPTPDGPAGVGVAASGFASTVVYYPAIAGTGRGHYRYVTPLLATAAGLEPAQMDRVLSTAQIDATPAPDASPRHVIVLSPGWRSLIAFSTSMAEDLASHGYVVLATQTDVAAEWSHDKSSAQDRAKRLKTIDDELEFLDGPTLPAIVGPIDVRQVAVGGHSYAGTIAFDAAPNSNRIAAAIDLDGSARGEAVRPPSSRPTLVLVTIDAGQVSDPALSGFVNNSPKTVAVGLLDTLHMDITDAPTITRTLGSSVFSTLVGPIGPLATTQASTIVIRYLDAVLGVPGHQPTAAELVNGLRSTTVDPFGTQAPAAG